MIPLVNLQIQYKFIKKRIDKAIQKTLSSGNYILGSELKLFEDDLRKFFKVPTAVGLASGTDALSISLKTLGIKSGDGVILPANSYPSAFGVALTGVKIQLADVDPNTLLLSVNTIKKAVTKQTKAIILVHLYGNPVDMDPIIKFAKQKKIYVIEDCAQSFGATYKGKMVGTIGDLGCLSFYPTKNLGAYGDGGAIISKNKKLEKIIQAFRMYGEVDRYKSVLVGQNSRLDEIQAAILRVKLRFVKSWNKKRQALAKTYKNKLKSLPITLINESLGGISVHHLFVIRVKQREALKKFLFDKKIITALHYPIPIHLVESFKDLGYKLGDFPIVESSAKEILSIPLFPELSRVKQEKVIKTISDFFKRQ